MYYTGTQSYKRFSVVRKTQVIKLKIWIWKGDEIDQKGIQIYDEYDDSESIGWFYFNAEYTEYITFGLHEYNDTDPVQWWTQKMRERGKKSPIERIEFYFHSSTISICSTENVSVR